MAMAILQTPMTKMVRVRLSTTDGGAVDCRLEIPSGYSLRGGKGDLFVLQRDSVQDRLRAMLKSAIRECPDFLTVDREDMTTLLLTGHALPGEPKPNQATVDGYRVIEAGGMGYGYYGRGAR